MEEIREAGHEMPDVNQIEVSLKWTSLSSSRDARADQDVPRVTQLHPLNQQKEIVEYCKKHGIFVEAYAPLMRAQWNIPAILEIAPKVRLALLHPVMHCSADSHTFNL